jgi:hypothetical protein
MMLSLVRAANAEGWRLSDYHESGDELLFVPFEDDQAGDEDDEIVTDGGIEIEREDCPRCGGSGEVTEMVAGRSASLRARIATTCRSTRCRTTRPRTRKRG